MLSPQHLSFEELSLPCTLGFGYSHPSLCAFYTHSSKSGHVPQAWPITYPTALSPQLVCDGHKANQSLCLRSDLFLNSRKKEEKKKEKRRWEALRSVWLRGLKTTFPATRSGAQKEANLEQKRVKQQSSRTVSFLLGFSVHKPIHFFLATNSSSGSVRILGTESLQIQKPMWVRDVFPYLLKSKLHITR